MKKGLYIWPGIMLLLTTLFVACYQGDDVDPDPPVFSTAEDINNPPDEFRVLYSLKNIGNFNARIRFDTNAVWKLEKETAPSSLFWIERVYEDSIAVMTIDDEMIVGLEGGIFYNFVANNNNYPLDRDLFVHFTKLPYNYENYPVKF